MGGDLPDWTVAVSNLRYLGTRHTNIATFDVIPTALDRAVIVKVPGSSTGGQTRRVTVGSSLLSVQTFTGLVGGGQLVVGYINPDLDSTWHVDVDSGPNGLEDWYFFADTALPVFDLIRGGQQLMAASVPVVMASDQVANVRRQVTPADSMLVSAPAAATLATVTFPATAGFRWIIDHVVWTFRTTAAATAVAGVAITAGAATLYNSALSLPATIGAIDREVLGPGAAYVGPVNTAVVVAFSGAGPANTVERVTASAYLVS